MEQKSFLFYKSWETQLDLLEDDELRRFLKNLFRYHNGESVELVTNQDKLVWFGILPGLETNKNKYERKVTANRENGKLGGAPAGNQNAKKSETTQNNPNNLIKDKREKKTGKRKKIKDKREKTNDNWEQETGKSQQIIENTGSNTGIYTGVYTGTSLLGHEIEEINYIINTKHTDARLEGKDSFFKGYVIENLQEKILSTGFLKSGFFKYFKQGSIKIAEQQLTPEEYKSVEPLLLEYIDLVYNY